jgi:Mrp family chromosome partitioning ATPase
VLCVVRYGKTRRDQVQDMAAALRTVDGHVLGTVLNMAPARRGGYYYYYDGYGPKDEPKATPNDGDRRRETQPARRATGTTYTAEVAR